MKVQFDPMRLKPRSTGTYTLSIWKGESFTFNGAGAYEVPSAIAKHPDWEPMVAAGGITEIKPPKAEEPKAKTAPKKSAGGAKDTTEPG